MITKKDLAELIFPDVNETIEDLEKRYPERNLENGAFVTRFAPSPTGFLHTGSLFTAMIASKCAKDTNGIFYLRLEDTDSKREIEGSANKLVEQLRTEGIECYYTIDAGPNIKVLCQLRNSKDIIQRFSSEFNNVNIVNASFGPGITYLD